MAGRVDYYFSPIAPVIGQIQNGQLVPLAVGSPKRAAALPNVPTTAEAGVPGSEFNFWIGMFAPGEDAAGDRRPPAGRSEKALATPEVKERFAALGADAWTLKPEQFDAYIRDEIKANAALVKAAGLEVPSNPRAAVASRPATQGPSHANAKPRDHHARRHRTHGHEPAPDPLHRRDPRPGRRDAVERRQGDARPDPDRPQRREDRGARPAHGIARWGTDLDEALANKDDTVFFDAGTTQMRPTLLAKAIRAGKHVYCEKPIATNLNEAVEIARLAEKSGLKHGAVQDKLFLPGLRKLDMLRRAGFFGRMLSVRSSSATGCSKATCSRSSAPAGTTAPKTAAA